MSMVQFFGQWQEQAAAADESDRWGRWVACQPSLAAAGSATRLGQLVADRSDPARANAFLLALAQVGSVDGGADPAAATFVASLLVPGGDRMARSLWSLGGEVEQIIAGQLWIQVRVYPWRTRPGAVAKNILMETRRAVLADFGASTATSVALVPLPPPEIADVVDQRSPDLADEPTADQVLLNVLVWARSRGILTAAAATLLWDLVVLAADLTPNISSHPTSQPNGSDRGHGTARGAGSLAAAARAADSRGVSPRSVRRQRDRAVSTLRRVQNDYARDNADDRAGLDLRALVPAGAATHGREPS